MRHSKFVMCTDDFALDHIERELSIEGLNLNNPRSQLQAEILEALTKPENIGDSHIRMLLKYFEKYSINPELVKLFIKSYFKLLWDKTNELSSKLELEVLVGEHQESAFLEVRSNEACTKAQLAPLIAPRSASNDGISIFINHLDAVSIRRIDLAKFFADKIGHHQQGLDAVRNIGMLKINFLGNYL
mgnify:CR=1 FL=1|jgi:hypothetical protein